ncbi:MAG TPA: S8 family serine peptidase [Candidatus Thermoplasmatota archaeon]|nr:S8 family serine peptidase [Candidatus Thermoplasmatota archaeon]
MTTGVSALAASPSEPAPIASSIPTHTISGLSEDDLAKLDIHTVDHYGGFVTAVLSPEDVDRLQDSEAILVSLDHRVKRGNFALTDDIPLDLRASLDSRLFIVKFRGPITSTMLSDLSQRRVQVHEYIPNYAVVVESVRPSDFDGIPAIETLTPYHPAFKLAGDLDTNHEAKIVIVSPLTASDSEVRHAVAAAEGTITSVASTFERRLTMATVPAGAVTSIARSDAVLWIEPARDEGYAAMLTSAGLSQSGAATNRSVNDQGVTGSTQRIVVCDTGVTTHRNDSYAGHNVSWITHPMFNRSSASDSEVGLIEFNAHLLSSPAVLPPHPKVVMYYAPVDENGNIRGDGVEDDTTHGERTAHIAAGDRMTNASLDPLDGYSFASQLFLCDISIGNDLTGAIQFLNTSWPYVEPAYDRGARVASFSLGRRLGPVQNGSIGNNYTEWARQWDEIQWENRDLTVVRSIGNSVPDPQILAEAVAKNTITVGATEHNANFDGTTGNPELVYAASNRGPTADGRIKPNIVAPGAAVYAAHSGGSYGNLSGTSFAAPAVAGSAALVRDYFEKGYYPTGVANGGNARLNTSAALVHAILQSAGREISLGGSPPFPNSIQGWGKLLLENSLYFAGDSRKLLVADEWEGKNLTTGQMDVRMFNVTGSAPLRVMLVWTDYPGTTGAGVTLVNDLHLRVGAPGLLGSNETYIGNAFVVNETAPGKNYPADVLNVEEAVYINHPTVGTYSVRAVGHNVPRPEGQRYALVITGDVAWA